MLLSLKYEQSLLTSDFNPPCVNRECIIKWWKLSRPKPKFKRGSYRELYPSHCNQCHMCEDNRDRVSQTKCSRCSIVFCFYCKKLSGRIFEDYEFVCTSCIMNDFKRKWPDITPKQIENKYYSFIGNNEPIKYNDYTYYLCK